MHTHSPAVSVIYTSSCFTKSARTDRSTNAHLASPEEDDEEEVERDDHSAADPAHADVLPRQVQQAKLSPVLKQTTFIYLLNNSTVTPMSDTWQLQSTQSEQPIQFH